MVRVGGGASLKMLLDGCSVRFRGFLIVLGIVFRVRFLVTFGVKDADAFLVKDQRATLALSFGGNDLLLLLVIVRFRTTIG